MIIELKASDKCPYCKDKYLWIDKHIKQCLKRKK